MILHPFPPTQSWKRVAAASQFSWVRCGSLAVLSYRKYNRAWSPTSLGPLLILRSFRDITFRYCRHDIVWRVSKALMPCWDCFQQLRCMSCRDGENRCYRICREQQTHRFGFLYTRSGNEGNYSDFFFLCIELFCSRWRWRIYFGWKSWFAPSVTIRSRTALALASCSWSTLSRARSTPTVLLVAVVRCVKSRSTTPFSSTPSIAGASTTTSGSTSTYRCIRTCKVLIPAVVGILTPACLGKEFAGLIQRRSITEPSNVFMPARIAIFTPAWFSKEFAYLAGFWTITFTSSFWSVRPRNVSMSAAFSPLTPARLGKELTNLSCGRPPRPRPSFPSASSASSTSSRASTSCRGRRKGRCPSIYKVRWCNSTVRCRATVSSIVWNWPKRHGLWKRSLTFLNLCENAASYIVVASSFQHVLFKSKPNL